MRFLAAVACFALGVWLTPRYDIAPIKVASGSKPRCSIVRVGSVRRMSDVEYRRTYQVPANTPPPKSGEWTVIDGWWIDCTDVDPNIEVMPYTVEELETIERLSKGEGR